MVSHNPKGALKISIVKAISRQHCALHLTPNRYALDILQKLAMNCPDHAATDLLWNAAFWLSGVSSMRRQPVAGYETPESGLDAYQVSPSVNPLALSR